MSEAESVIQAPRPAYPAAWEFDGLLTSGAAVLVRPIRSDDAATLTALRAEATFDLVLLDHFGLRGEAGSPDTSYLSEVDYASHMAFVAISWGDLVGIASYARLGAADPSAEVAFVVAGSCRHLGVATLLFESLSAYARTQGIERFVGTVVAEDNEMLDVLSATGLRMDRVADGAAVKVGIDLSPTTAYRAACDAREAISETASMAAVLRPKTIAVVGAGRHPGNTGHEVVRSLLAGGFVGKVFPVNPSAQSICDQPAFPNLSVVPDPIDLAIVAVPSPGVRAVLEEAASTGVRAVTIITAGFAETGRAGAEVEAELLSVARRHGMRIVGPNCLGVVNTDPGVKMNATFTGLDPLPGRLALVSQSGAVGVVLAKAASGAGLGLSSFVSVGNKLDVTSNDLLCFFERDERTSVIALYLESLGNPRKFGRIARRVGEHKPIVALKAGRSVAGARGARSHTAAAATPEVAVESLLRGSGVIKVDHLDELLDVSAVLLDAPLPNGRRVALVGNSGGPLILAADACEADGLVVPELDAATKEALAEVLAAAAATSNPVDLTADGTGAVLEQALDVVLRDDAIDAVIVVATELVAMSAVEARAAVDRVAKRATKPLIACVLGGTESSQAVEAGGAAQVPSPERAAAALDHVCRYAEWRRRRETPAGEGKIGVGSAAREIVADSLAASDLGGWLELEEAARLLEACGVPVLPTRAAASADEAAVVAESLGFPVALKARSGDLVHKSDVGGVVVGLGTVSEVRDAYSAMANRLGPQMGGAVLQPMAPSGVEAIVGLVSDPAFGPLVMVGLGGVMTDLLGDRAFATPPLDPGDAEAMVASLRAARLLDGYRGTPPVDRHALVQILEQVARIAEDVPELVELDLNPILVSSGGALAVDCKARLAPRHPGPGPDFRSLGARARD